MMHPLAWLWWRDSRNAARGLLLQLRRPRGALAATGLLLFCAVVGFTTRRAPAFGSNLHVFGAPALIVLVVLGAFSPLGLYFRPADVDWLMPAPLERRELVLYNVALRGRTAFLSGLLLSLLPAWRGTGWWQAFTGYTLVFLLLQTSAQWIAVVRAWLALRCSPRARRVLAVAVIGLPLTAAAIDLRLHPELSFREFFAQSPTLAILGAPARPFLGTISASDAMEWLRNALLAVAILAAGTAHICVLAVPYREAAVQQSERRERRFARMRSGGGSFGGGPANSSRRVPMFPRLGGAGPVAWRQIQELVRNPRGIVMILTIVATVAGAAILIPLLRGGDPELVVRMGRAGILLVAFLPLLMGENLACDFRRDLDRMGQLKSWPIAPLALAAGQIAPAAAFATSVQLLGVAVLVAATSAISQGTALLVMALLPVVSWVALCIDNLLFLWMPYRTVPEDPGDMAFVGRTFATAMLKLVSLVAILGGTLALGSMALYVTGSPVGAVGVPVLCLLAACVAGTMAVARAFRRFDVSHGVPV